MPVAADVAARLAHCRNTVTDDLGGRPSGEPFFPAPSGQPYSISTLRDAFHAVLAAAEIPRQKGGRSLRLHDLRHSFAVLRLTLWNRQQASPGNLLPALATYLGHVGIVSSQRYLHSRILFATLVLAVLASAHRSPLTRTAPRTVAIRTSAHGTHAAVVMLRISVKRIFFGPQGSSISTSVSPIVIAAPSCGRS